MKTFIITLCVLFISLLANGQDEYTREFGRVTAHEITMAEYAPDKDAEAVVLNNSCSYFFTPSKYSINDLIELNIKITKKIKILKQSGIKYAEFALPYYKDKERIVDIEGITYNLENGEIITTDLSSKNIFEEKTDKDIRVLRIAMPDVREGSIIELKYKIVSSLYTYVRDWYFQEKIPVVYSELKYAAIPYFEYIYILRGAAKFDDLKVEDPITEYQVGHLKYKERIFTMTMKNLPAFRDEEFISAQKDFMVNVHFQLAKYHHPRSSNVEEIMSTWPKICDIMLKDADFGKYINSSVKESKDLLKTMNIADKTPDEKIKTITEYVKANYNWDGTITKYAENKAGSFVKQKKGNSAEINLFLLGMLQAAGIKAEPVALSTRSNGIIDQNYPFAQFLNYVIVQASTPDTTYLLDATENMLFFDELPERCCNVYGLVIKPKSEEWIPVMQKEVAFTQKNFDLKFNNTVDTLIAETAITSYSHDAYHYRALYHGDKDELIKYLEAKDITSIENIDIKNYKETDHPFIFSFKNSSAAELMDNKLLIHPFLNQSVTQNIFKQDNRAHPIDLINYHTAQYNSTIEIPKGYKIEHLPENKERRNSIITITYKTNVEGNKISVTAGYEMKKVIYPALHYQLLKDNYDEMIKKFNDVIVLTKE